MIIMLDLRVTFAVLKNILKEESNDKNRFE